MLTSLYVGVPRFVIGGYTSQLMSRENIMSYKKLLFSAEREAPLSARPYAIA